MENKEIISAKSKTVKHLDEKKNTGSFLVQLSQHKSVKGGIRWDVTEATDANKYEKELTSKIVKITKELSYTKDIYPLTVENVIAQSKVTYTYIQQLVSLLPQKSIFTKEGKPLKHNTNTRIELSFRLQKIGTHYKFSHLLSCGGKKVSPILSHFKDCGILTDDTHIYFWKDVKDMEWFIKTLDIQNKTFSQQELKDVFFEYVAPLQKEYIIHLDSQLIKEYISPKKKKPKPLLSITTEKKRIVFQMTFVYGHTEVTPPALQRYYVLSEDQYIIQLDRDKEEEEHWLQEIMSLHSDFELTGEYQWMIPLGKVSKSWTNSFFETLQGLDVQIKDNNISIHDQKTYTPSIQIKLLRNANWFDAILDIRIENKIIPVQEIQEAILSNKQEIHIEGNAYLLSKDWIKKYRNIFLWGKITQNKLRFSQYQEHLFDFLGDCNISSEKGKPKQKIDKNVSLPKSLANTLRDYQKEGFQWMNILQQTGKGGILADDMGLGKTIQTLAQLLKFYETYDKLTALIICPASLINNWKEEVLKFTPKLNYFIYHSQDRTITVDDISKHQIIITSYNILQKDIKILQSVNFDYIVLDESQYIKNPHSKTTRCVFSLNSKHRLCLSGTPLQNHTFDIFSQIHFLNPSILGSIEHFKQRFAILIDQYEEKESINELRQLLDPFVLRRTKKQVAKDLPDRTESIIYCNMESTQREIYEYYRERHRSYLLDKIKKDGLQKSKFHVLQGLTFLRQICNSPLLVKEGITFKETPIKLKMLKERMISPDGENKALIFSQFIGMLSLIEEEIKKDKWTYAYFDGKTSLEKRTSEIKRFQTSEACKLFLISIKAGNVGLNLTAADYVYLIDPWWNPAIEQQAIDRTHRIGQHKNIFSFKFICTNTIEEKIVLLQKKKSNLADNLILLNQNNLIKNLDSTDIEYLFSE